MTRWTAERVGEGVRTMHSTSSPGVRGIPVFLWKVLPPAFLARVADLLRTLPNGPGGMLLAYVTMIPKASRGTRPQDQRPITVLDVLYRIWAKGTALTWAPVLQVEYLDPATMGFRAQAGTLHLALLLSDLIGLQRSRRQGPWLVSFDVEKCFPSLPW